MKNKLNLFLISCAGLFLVLACSNTSNITKPTTNTAIATTTNSTQDVAISEKPIIIKADALTKEYDENEIAADEKYKSKTLEISGKVSNIAETLGKLTVQLEGHKQNGMNLVSVMCNFDESEKATVSKLKKGQQTTLIGTGDGKTLGFYVGLNQCKIK